MTACGRSRTVLRMAIAEHVGHVPPAWPRRPARWQSDAGLAVVIGAVQIAGTYLASRHQHGRAGFDGWAILLLAVGPGALVVRRRAPIAVLLTVFGSTLLYSLLDYPRGPIFFAL